MSQEQTLNYMTLNMLQTLEHLLDIGVVDKGAKIVLSYEDKEDQEVDVKETLDICIGYLSQKLNEEA